MASTFLSGRLAALRAPTSVIAVVPLACTNLHFLSCDGCLQFSAHFYKPGCAGKCARWRCNCACAVLLFTVSVPRRNLVWCPALSLKYKRMRALIFQQEGAARLKYLASVPGPPSFHAINSPWHSWSEIYILLRLYFSHVAMCKWGEQVLRM